MMYKASASAKDDRGVGIPLPLPHNPLIYTSVSSIPDKLVLVSFPAKQFEQFERVIQDANNTSSLIPDDCVTNLMSSYNVSPRNKSITSSRSHPPTLINTKVQDFSNTNILMEVKIDAENASHKRALPLSTSENQRSTKA